MEKNEETKKFKVTIAFKFTEVVEAKDRDTAIAEAAFKLDSTELLIEEADEAEVCSVEEVTNSSGEIPMKNLGK